MCGGRRSPPCSALNYLGMRVMVVQPYLDVPDCSLAHPSLITYLLVASLALTHVSSHCVLFTHAGRRSQ